MFNWKNYLKLEWFVFFVASFKIYIYVEENKIENNVICVSLIDWMVWMKE